MKDGTGAKRCSGLLLPNIIYVCSILPILKTLTLIQFRCDSHNTENIFRYALQHSTYRKTVVETKVLRKRIFYGPEYSYLFLMPQKKFTIIQIADI